MRKTISMLLTCVLLNSQASIAATLEIYFIDVEGGQATLVVTPARETLLIDAGWGEGSPEARAGVADSARDAKRILAAARDAGVTRIDYQFITHFHRDHMGGVPELAQLLPIGSFIDHGGPIAREKASGSVDTPDAIAFDAYAKARSRGRHITPKPGDSLPLKGIQSVLVSSDRSTVQALKGAGAPNSACGVSPIKAGDGDENPRSNGVLLQFGKFRFLDIGDLSGQPLFDLVCPTDRIGPVDVYLVAHHGGRDAADPATFAAFKPRVSIINNGPRKGGTSEVIAAARTVGFTDVWQLHTLEAATENVPQERIANLDEASSHWIRISASEDGSFKLLNGRTGIWKAYGAR
jgi:beta-lactamase superfamily II metal-dependent hydrolase